VKVAKATTNECKEGGATVSNASGTAKACNGTTGFTETLPSGKTETGTWAVETTATATEELVSAVISIPIPLAVPAQVGGFVAAGAKTPPEHCEGSLEKPGAKTGYLCIFEGKSQVINHGGLEWAKAFVTPDGKIGSTVEPTGGQLVFSTTKTGRVSAEGTWAVTG
jgi:hypothetical protein